MIRVLSVKSGRLPERGATVFLLVNFRVDQIQDGRAELLTNATPRASRGPKLTDESGQAYDFLGDFCAEARPPNLDLLLAEDRLLLFELPPSQAKNLQLELPASAWGRDGICRFRIAEITHESAPNMAMLVAQTKAMLLSSPALPPDPAGSNSLFQDLHGMPYAVRPRRQYRSGSHQIQARRS